MLLIRYLWALPNTLFGLALIPIVLLSKGQVRAVEGVLELHGRFLSWLLGRCVPLPGGAAALTLGHVVIARDEAALGATRRHERVHVRQCERWGPAFLPAYAVASMWAVATGGGAYADNYFEREAVAEACRRDA